MSENLAQTKRWSTCVRLWFDDPVRVMSRSSKNVAVQVLLSDALSFRYLDSSQKPLLEWPVCLVCCSGKQTALVEFSRELTSPQPATMVWNQVGDGRKAGEVDRERSVICFLLLFWTLDFYLELCMRERWTDENLQVLNGDGILRIWFFIGGVLGEWRVGPGLQSIHLPSTNFLRSFRVIWGSLHRIQVLWMRSVVVLMEELKPKPSQRRSERCDCHHQKKCLLTAK